MFQRMNDQTSTALAVEAPARDFNFKLGNCIVWTDRARASVPAAFLRSALVWHRDGDSGLAGGEPQAGKPFRSVFAFLGGKVSVETDDSVALVNPEDAR